MCHDDRQSRTLQMGMQSLCNDRGCSRVERGKWLIEEPARDEWKATTLPTPHNTLLPVRGLGRQLINGPLETDNPNASFAPLLEQGSPASDITLIRVPAA